MQDYLKNLGGRSAQAGFNQGELNRIEVPIPPLNEQDDIVRILDTVRERLNQTKREITLERERKAALTEHLFAHGTHGEKTKQTEAGETPESWRVVPFGEAVEIASGQVDPRSEPYASMPHVGPENIEAETGRLLPTKSARQCNLISGKYLFTNDDVLYSKIRPYLRKAAIPDYTGICSADMYAVRGKPGMLDRDFLYHYLLGEAFTRCAVAFQNRTGIPKINREQLGRIALPLPDIKEQREIGSVLTGCKQKADALQHEMLILEELFSALLEELMSGRLDLSKLADRGTAN